MEGRKVGEVTLGVKLKGVDEVQARLDEAAGHIAAAREILDSLADVVSEPTLSGPIRRPATGRRKRNDRQELRAAR